MGAGGVGHDVREKMASRRGSPGSDAREGGTA